MVHVQLRANFQLFCGYTPADTIWTANRASGSKAREPAGCTLQRAEIRKQAPRAMADDLSGERESPFRAALCEQSRPAPPLTDAEVASNLEEQNDEEEALSAIFDDNFARLHDVTPTSPDFFSPSHAAQGAAAGWRAAGAREFEYEVSIEVKFSGFGARVFLGARDDAAREEAGENAGGGGAAGALMYYAIEHLPPVRLRWRNVPTVREQDYRMQLIAWLHGQEGIIDDVFRIDDDVFRNRW